MVKARAVLSTAAGTAVGPAGAGVLDGWAGVTAGREEPETDESGADGAEVEQPVVRAASDAAEAIAVDMWMNRVDRNMRGLRPCAVDQLGGCCDPLGGEGPQHPFAGVSRGGGLLLRARSGVGRSLAGGQQRIGVGRA
ncbi:hypothetical protein GCM10017688_05580 [Streptomyces ramulosus]